MDASQESLCPAMDKYRLIDGDVVCVLLVSALVSALYIIIGLIVVLYTLDFVSGVRYISSCNVD